MVSVIVIKYSDWRIPIDSIRTCYYLLAGLGPIQRTIFAWIYKPVNVGKKNLLHKFEQSRHFVQEFFHYNDKFDQVKVAVRFILIAIKPPLASFSLYFIYFQKKLQKKTADLSRIRARIFRPEGKHIDHKTTTTALLTSCPYNVGTI